MHPSLSQFQPSNLSSPSSAVSDVFSPTLMRRVADFSVSPAPAYDRRTSLSQYASVSHTNAPLDNGKSLQEVPSEPPHMAMHSPHQASIPIASQVQSNFSGYTNVAVARSLPKWNARGNTYAWLHKKEYVADMLPKPLRTNCLPASLYHSNEEFFESMKCPFSTTSTPPTAGMVQSLETPISWKEMSYNSSKDKANSKTFRRHSTAHKLPQQDEEPEELFFSPHSAFGNSPAPGDTSHFHVTKALTPRSSPYTPPRLPVSIEPLPSHHSYESASSPNKYVSKNIRDPHLPLYPTSKRSTQAPISRTRRQNEAYPNYFENDPLVYENSGLPQVPASADSVNLDRKEEKDRYNKLALLRRRTSIFALDPLKEEPVPPYSSREKSPYPLSRHPVEAKPKAPPVYSRTPWPRTSRRSLSVLGGAEPLTRMKQPVDDFFDPRQQDQFTAVAVGPSYHADEPFQTPVEGAATSYEGEEGLHDYRRRDYNYKESQKSRLAMGEVPEEHYYNTYDATGYPKKVSRQQSSFASNYNPAVMRELPQNHTSAATTTSRYPKEAAADSGHSTPSSHRSQVGSRDVSVGPRTAKATRSRSVARTIGQPVSRPNTTPKSKSSEDALLTYTPAEELMDITYPINSKSLQQLASQLKLATTSDWAAQVSALIDIRRIAKYHPSVLFHVPGAPMLLSSSMNLKITTMDIVKLFNSPRSALAKHAALCLIDLFAFGRKSMDLAIDEVTVTCLKKSSQTSSDFLSDAAFCVLVQMCNSTSPNRALSTILHETQNSRHQGYKTVGVKCLAVLMRRLHRHVLKLKELPEIIQLLLNTCHEASPEIRNASRVALAVLFRTLDGDLNSLYQNGWISATDIHEFEDSASRTHPDVIELVLSPLPQKVFNSKSSSSSSLPAISSSSQYRIASVPNFTKHNNLDGEKKSANAQPSYSTRSMRYQTSGIHF